MQAPSFTTLVCDLNRNRWVQDDRGFTALAYEGTLGDFLGGGEAGDIYALEDGIMDAGGVFTLKYISRFDDQGAPENQKTYQDLVVIHDTQGAVLTVELILNNGDHTIELGTIASETRTETTLPIPEVTGGDVQQGARGQNCAVYIHGDASTSNITPATLYGVNLHFFVEPRYTMVWDSDEQDFGTREVKAVRALEFDVENSGTLQVQVSTDLPGNQTVCRVQRTIPAAARRRPVQIPITEYVEGRHIRVQVYTDDDRPFLLWGARILLQPYGTYIEAYEGAAGQRYDSFQVDFGTPDMKMARELELDCDTDGVIEANLLSDYPGNTMAVRKATMVDTTDTTAGRRMVHIPLERLAERQYPEGRLWQLTLTGQNALRLYGARLELRAYGEFVEGYQSTGGRTWSSDPVDLGTPHVKEIREVQLDIDTAGALTLNVWTELPGLGLAIRATKTVNTEPTTTGRRMVNVPLAADGVPVEGRIVRLELLGSSEFRLFGAWVFARAIGYYVEAYQAADGHIWDSTVLDLGTPLVKRIQQVYLEAHTDSVLTVRVYTSNAAGEMTLRATESLPPSTGRKPYIVPLEGVYGRLARVTASSVGAFRLFHARLSVKPIGVYLNADSEAVFAVEAEQDLASERVKMFKEIEVVYAGVGTLEFATDQAGTLAAVKTFDLAITTLTKTAKLKLPPNAQGRLVRVTIRPGSTDLAVFACRVWMRTVGESGAVLWQWVSLPIPATPDNYGPADLYLAPTPPAWEWGPIFVPKTPLDWTWVPFPVTRTPELPVWASLPVKDAPAQLPTTG